MIRRRRHPLFVAVCAVACSLAGIAQGKPTCANFASGDPGIKSIDAIAFASDGVLLISDGQSSRIVAVQTGDNAGSGGAPRVTNVIHEIASRMGAADKDVEIAAVKVNPASGRAYLLVKKLDEKRNVLLSVGGSGELAVFDLKNATYSAMLLPKTEGGSPRVSEMAWAGDRLVCSARTGEEFASKLLVFPAPLGADSAAAMISAETYHISHRKWETKAPMAALFPYEENGKRYIVGGFGCTPIVRYPIDAITDGAKVKGESVLELGSGNRPLDMFSYVHDGKPSVIVNTFRSQHQRAPLSPTPYWTCRFDGAILSPGDKINEKALQRNTKKPDDATVTMVSAFHGVMHMDKLDDGHALVVRAVDGRQDLEALALP